MNLQKYISHKVNRLGWFTSPKRPYPPPPYTRENVEL